LTIEPLVIKHPRDGEVAPFRGFGGAGGFRSLHSLFRICTENQSPGHLVAVCQSHDNVGDLLRITWATCAIRNSFASLSMR